MAAIEAAFISRSDTLVVPGIAMAHAMDLILTPRIRAMMAEHGMRWHSRTGLICSRYRP